MYYYIKGLTLANFFTAVFSSLQIILHIILREEDELCTGRRIASQNVNIA